MMSLWLLAHALFLAASDMSVPQVNLRIETSQPLWVANLLQYGFIDYEHSWGQGANPERMIAFSNNEEVVVLNQTFEKPYQSTVRAFVLDAKSGSLRKRSEWTMQTRSGVFPIRGGGYAVLEKHGTALYGRGFEKTSVTTRHSVEMVSPNGGRLAARARKSGHSLWITLDPDTLSETGILSGAYKPSISENAFADLRLGGKGGPVLEIFLGENAPLQRQLNRGAAPARFVSEGSLALVVDKHFEVVSVTGDQLFTGKLKYDWHQFATCRAGSKMAVVEQRWGEIRGRMSKELVRVFDLRRKTMIWSAKNRALSWAVNARSGVALSPDCSLLAIRSMGLVRVFRLPAAEGSS